MMVGYVLVSRSGGEGIQGKNLDHITFCGVLEYEMGVLV